MFWGVTIENGKRYSQIVDSSFHVSMAALECISEENKKSKPVSVMIEHEKTEYLLCTLTYNSHPQQALDLNFIEGEEVTFFINGHGAGTVHLTGYLIDSNEDMNESSDIEMEEDSESEEENMIGPNLKRKAAAAEFENLKKKKKVDMSKEFAYIVDKKIEDDSELEDESEDEDESSDSDEKGKVFAKSPKKGMTENKGKKSNLQKNKLDLGNALMQKTKKIMENNSPATQNKTPKKEDSQSPKKTPGGKSEDTQGNQLKTPQNGLNLSGTQSEEGTKKKKRKRNRKKNKGNLNVSGDSSQNESMGNLNLTPSIQKSKPNTPKTPAQKKAGGTIVDDVTIGSGPVAKQGKFVHITYEGKLQNNKVFDSSKKDPLKFRLGKGEVIKGMEAGIEGMKVGGKRRITIPPNQGYGNKQVGPIPPNSTLIFDIELKAVS